MMNKSNYDNKMLDHPLKKISYKKISRDPNNKIMKEVALDIKELFSQ